MNKTRLFLEKMIFLHDFEEYWIHLCRSSLHPFLVNATLVFSLAFNFRKSYRQQHQVLRKSSSDYISSYSTSFLKKRDADNHLINIYNEPVFCWIFLLIVLWHMNEYKYCVWQWVVRREEKCTRQLGTVCHLPFLLLKRFT